MRLLHLLPWKLWLLCFSSPLACSPFVLSTSRTMATRRTDRQFGEHEEMKYLIAVATGQAHDHFPVNDVVQMLMFTSDQQFLKYMLSFFLPLSIYLEAVVASGWPAVATAAVPLPPRRSSTAYSSQYHQKIQLPMFRFSGSIELLILQLIQTTGCSRMKTMRKVGEPSEDFATYIQQICYDLS
ncbi:uncharacterized protein [Lolium perenne]|uniref:uncharacterized protein isoform X4 n=1 Tax=Lolium perenne TaxID=4522 RepID=UPI003A9917A9